MKTTTGEKETLTFWPGIQPLVIIVLSNVDVIMLELNLLTKCLSCDQMSTESSKSRGGGVL